MSCSVSILRTAKGIEPGIELRLRDDDTVTVEVVDERLVRMDDVILSVTAATEHA